MELMKDMNQTTCELDPCISELVYKCPDVLKGSLTKMVTLSLRQVYSFRTDTSNSQAFKKINLGTELKNY